MLTPYQNTSDLINKLYHVFLSQMQARDISADSGSGLEVLPLIDSSIEDAIAKREIPTSSTDLAAFPQAVSYLEQAEANIKRLADAMAEDANAANVKELHEWSLNNVKRRLCPLYPFFREPCSQYD